jgi:hypothetical protein
MLFECRSEDPCAEIDGVLAPGAYGHRLGGAHGNAIDELHGRNACCELRAVCELLESLPLPLSAANALVRRAREEVGKLPGPSVNFRLTFFAQHAGTGDKSVLADTLPGDGTLRRNLLHPLCRRLGRPQLAAARIRKRDQPGLRFCRFAFRCLACLLHLLFGRACSGWNKGHEGTDHHYP